ncbi:hypothetical protein [Methylobacter sp.]|uniref:hypothetical protein n=1 Tax=Methylobacter sp. TaxID=2051955 RepID=UPI001215D061|nr:hypothetical protein [Methylobacter sp.]TAK63199.1 MAG: hypothetical protein EPO18_07760 [Methylobacter sp.]
MSRRLPETPVLAIARTGLFRHLEFVITVSMPNDSLGKAGDWVLVPKYRYQKVAVSWISDRDGR